MRYWKVKVLCEGFEDVAQTKIARAYVRWLVDAETADEALTIGKYLAENASRLPMEILWKSFDPVEAALVGLPVSIDDLHSF